MNFKEPNLRRNMLVQDPIPGYWYSNIVGQLQQVRVVLHASGRIDRVMLENISGRRQCVDLDTWYRLDLILHSPGIERRRRRGRDDSTEHSS